MAFIQNIYFLSNLMVDEVLLFRKRYLGRVPIGLTKHVLRNKIRL